MQIRHYTPHSEERGVHLHPCTSPLATGVKQYINLELQTFRAICALLLFQHLIVAIAMYNTKNNREKKFMDYIICFRAFTKYNLNQKLMDTTLLGPSGSAVLTFIGHKRRQTIWRC